MHRHVLPGALTLILMAGAASAADNAVQRLPDGAQAVIEVSPMAGWFRLSEARKGRGYDALSLPLSRLVYVEDRQVPQGTGLKRTLTLLIDLEPQVSLVFDDESVTKPDQVLAVLAAAAQAAR